MKFVAVVALLASSIASASAADFNGYTGSDYSFVGFGHCLQAIPSSRDPALGYGHSAPLEKSLVTMDECAAHCQSADNLDGHVGFDTTHNQCLCRYTDGTGPVSATTEEGLTSDTGAAGAIGGTNGATNHNFCYRYNAYGGAYFGAYTGSDFTLAGQGYCIPEGSTGHYSHGTPWAPPAQFTMDECAAYCLGLNNIEGLPSITNTVGLVAMEVDSNGKRCLCRYTDGTGPQSADSEDGITYNTPASGPVAGTDGRTYAICWTYNWAFGQVSMRPLSTNFL